MADEQDVAAAGTEVGRIEGTAAQPLSDLGLEPERLTGETRGVGRSIYDQAFLMATGRPLTKLAHISGRTELDIMTESLRINGIEPTDEMMTRLALRRDLKR